MQLHPTLTGTQNGSVVRVTTVVSGALVVLALLQRLLVAPAGEPGHHGGPDHEAAVDVAVALDGVDGVGESQLATGNRRLQTDVD